jgi:hypothetical protein
LCGPRWQEQAARRNGDCKILRTGFDLLNAEFSWHAMLQVMVLKQLYDVVL